MSAVNLIIIGAGNRGQAYAKFAELCPDKVKIVGVAEPRKWHREDMAKRHHIPTDKQFKSWEEVVNVEKFADGVVIATQDAMHVEPVEQFAQMKYHILCEKPMAPNEEGCRRIHKAVKDNKIIFAVCHVLRYTHYTKKLIDILRAGKLGDLVSIQHLEPVGYWHQAHSFVRGNWRNETLSSPMLLQKSCHDLDWIRYVMDKSCKRVSSFGSLSFFKKSEQPEGATDNCLDCPAHIECTCPYSAKRIYFGFLNKGNKGWPVDVVVPDPTPKSLEEALRTGPYGRCVFACDNDVVDHQVVNMEFEGGATATFLMTAFTPNEGRKTTIHGTTGYLIGDSAEIKIYDYLTQNWTTIDTRQGDNSILGGHGGGDGGIMANFLDAVSKNDASLIISGPDISLETHVMVFRSEKARKQGTVEEIN